MSTRSNSYEINFDGIVGPTHNYSGLSYGNIASISNQQATSNPKEAALQGLSKMHELMKMGIKQAVLPPHERPHIPTLRSLGFRGTDAEILSKVQKQDPELLLACSSAAAMWTANAAITTPSSDSADKLVHFTPANLTNKFHRSIEAATTTRILEAIFHDKNSFLVHPPLPCGTHFADEGAANHTRFCKDYSEQGLHLFVYGRYAFKENILLPKKFPARQTFEASQAISRLHRLEDEQIVFAQQNPDAIDAGAFHNDVISVGNQNLFFYHEKAFVDTQRIIRELKAKFEDLICIEVMNREVNLQDAVSSYLFNSQIVTLQDKSMALIAPTECLEIPPVKNYLDTLLTHSEHPIKQIHYFNLRQSMRNGGGPACLRFRVVLNEKELQTMNPGVLLDEEKYKILCNWVKKHYRDRLLPNDLADPQLLQENRIALDELTKLLNLGKVYDFQL